MLIRLFSSSDKHSLQKIHNQHFIQINLVVDLMICVVSAEMMNKLIDERIYHKINIKITQFYDSNCRTHQCLKY